MIFDTHCHLNDEKLLPRVEEVIEDAHKIGVDKFLVVGWDKESSKIAIKLAEQYEGLYAAVGYHPENLDGVSEEDLKETLELSKHPKVVAIGEIGLDYYWEKDPVKKEKQKEFFIKQIEFANEHKLPISIHNRNAFDDCLKILEEHKPEFGGIMHCYSGSVESLKRVFDLGLLIGLGGTLTFTNSKTPKEVCEHAPLEKIVVETDSPYLAPHPLRGTVNEPKNLGWVIDQISELKGLSKKHVLDIIYKNSCEVFHV